jgi:hypothetical protein
VDDQQLWNLGVLHLKALHSDFTPGREQEMADLLVRYRQTKESLAAAVAETDASGICCKCGGECCLNGKYRLNVFDTLAHIAAKFPVPVNFSQKPICPYGSHAGCSMEPGLRPADCITFICDAIDQKLSLPSRLIFDAAEQELRECVELASRLVGEPLGTPLMLWAEKQI